MNQVGYRVNAYNVGLISLYLGCNAKITASTSMQKQAIFAATHLQLIKLYSGTVYCLLSY